MKIEEEIHQKKFTSEYQKMMINILFTSKWLEYKNACLLKNYGISTQQYNILRILRGQYPNCASIRTLQEKMLDKMSNASRLVEKLRLKGLVERIDDDKDRRLVRVTIKDKGLDMLKIIDNDISEHEKDLKNLTIEEAKLLNDLLDKLRSK